MQIPVQIAFRHYRPSEQAEHRIRSRLGKLEHLCSDIVSARVTVDQRSNPANGGLPPVVRIEVMVPHSSPVVVAYEPDRLQRKFQSPDLGNAINDAFDLVERQLRELKERRSGRPEATDHEAAYQFLGQVADIRPGDDHGFLLTKEGSQLYFHRDSILGTDFDRLRRGDEILYVEEVGDTGPRATKVRLKPS